MKAETADLNFIANKVKGKNHQGVLLECGNLPTLDLQDWVDSLGPEARLLMLDQIEDPQNVGGMLRTAAFLGMNAALMLRSKSSPLTPTVSKASAGAMESFPIIQVTNLSEAIRFLQSNEFFIYGADLSAESVDYRLVDPSSRAGLVMGNEGSGLRSLTQKRCDQLVEIPRQGPMESLNVGVAAGLLMAHFTRRE